ncbi:MAG TPA: glutamate synthase-related protein [Geobacteraceae bacterium]|nr:glutamate synthase-related protein [Geobacteraceae bacterium]
MPAKYHITVVPAPPKRKLIGKYCIVDWREDCSACHNCVKRECAYDVYSHERDRLYNPAKDYVDYLYECRGCLCCVQSCTKGLLTKQVNPEYLSMGDDVRTPDIVSSTWYQAETGRIPVSGAGYGGPFRGPGFDSIITDMSEIVRPTRDGIHGREYISTSVDIGRKPLRLEFNPDGSLATEFPPQVEVPLPIVFNTAPWHYPARNAFRAVADAAGKLGTFVMTGDPQLAAHPAVVTRGVPLRRARLAEWYDEADVLEQINAAKSANPGLVAIVKLPLGSDYVARALELADMGVDALHVWADRRGFVDGGAGGRHISDAVRELHLEFVRRGDRDSITLIAGGGIYMAEHVIKTIICGADMVTVDIPLMIALECRLCGKCSRGPACPVEMSKVDLDYAVQRIVNLMGAWHNQMLEMMGAMGIREVRRLRGEVGRAMFFDDLERECFGPIFGERKAL